MDGLATLPTLPIPQSESERAWYERDAEVRQWIARYGIRTFLRCPVVRNTMFVGNQAFIKDEYQWLRSLPNWKTRWQSATRENWIGQPPAATVDAGTSSQLIHHAFTAAHYEQWREVGLESYDCIVEVGGGYGSFARLCYNLGYRGRYIMFDLPAFAHLQSWYAEQVGMSVECHYDDEQWRAALPTQGHTLFVSLWALSETSARQREPLLQAIRDIDDFCIAYQGSFREMQNGPRFREWVAQMSGHIWHTERAYLFGARTL